MARFRFIGPGRSDVSEAINLPERLPSRSLPRRVRCHSNGIPYGGGVCAEGPLELTYGEPHTGPSPCLP